MINVQNTVSNLNPSTHVLDPSSRLKEEEEEGEEEEEEEEG